MTDMSERRLPVGIQSFEKIRKENYLYVDKTDLVWNLVNSGNTYNYLSRPRRFGKSVLVDTLQCYFEGRKELFEGLKIMNMEKNWVKRPVIRLDMSRGGANLRQPICRTFQGRQAQGHRPRHRTRQRGQGTHRLEGSGSIKTKK